MPSAIVDNLPAELLLAVFRHVFLLKYSTCSPNSANCMTCRRIGTAHVAWGPTESFDPADPALFPYALAAVSPRWSALLATVPEYWTRPVIFLDDPPSPSLNISDVLHLSRSLPIEVYITRRHFITSDDSDNEHERTRVAVDALKPHISRCQYIFVRLSRSSSLPSLRHDFTGTAPYLTQLKLECQIDDGVNNAAHSQPLPTVPLRCPALYTLLIDGPNFREIAHNYQSWWASTFSTLRSLIIRNLSSSGSPLSFSSALASLSVHTLHDLRTLTLNNITLDTTPTSLLPPIFPFALQMLHLSQIPFTLISHFFQYTFLGDLYSIRIESCRFPSEDLQPGSISIPNTFSLTLKHITHASHFISLLRFWGGRRLYIDSCPGFDDSVLDMMRSPLPENTLPADPTIPTFGCPNLSILYLNDCESYTPEGVKLLVEARNQPQASSLGTIELLTVSGKAPEITDGVKESFDELRVVKWAVDPGVFSS